MCIRDRYRAADAGVDIELNVRGICCLKTGPRPNGKVIRVVSIVDRYLEHARIFFFHHGAMCIRDRSLPQKVPYSMPRRCCVIGNTPICILRIQ